MVGSPRGEGPDGHPPKAHPLRCRTDEIAAEQNRWRCHERRLTLWSCTDSLEEIPPPSRLTRRLGVIGYSIDDTGIDEIRQGTAGRERCGSVVMRIRQMAWDIGFGGSQSLLGQRTAHTIAIRSDAPSGVGDPVRYQSCYLSSVKRNACTCRQGLVGLQEVRSIRSLLVQILNTAGPFCPRVSGL